MCHTTTTSHQEPIFKENNDTTHRRGATASERAHPHSIHTLKKSIHLLKPHHQKKNSHKNSHVAMSAVAATTPTSLPESSVESSSDATKKATATTAVMKEAVPSPVPEGSAHRSHSSSDDDEAEEEEVDITFANDEEANAARQVGLVLYNQAKYEEALDAQYAVVRHFTSKYGSLHPQCGLYYLDYGLSQLRVIQSRDSSAAALAPLDQEGLETCFMNLDAARLCFEKMENQRGLSDSEQEEVQLRLAETRNAIAQVNIEQEDYDKALKEYEMEVLIYRSLTNPQPRKLVSALYGIAECYMKECDFEQAEVWYNKILEEVASTEGQFDAELISELEQLRDEAKNMKGGNYATIQEMVRQQFLPEEVEDQVLQDVLAGGDDGKAGGQSAAGASSSTNPFLSAVPLTESGSLGFGTGASGPSSGNLLVHAAPVNGEQSNSQSISLFRPQGHSRSSTAEPVVNQHVAVKKKPKAAPAAATTTSMSSQSQSSTEALVAADSDEPCKKKPRTESA